MVSKDSEGYPEQLCATEEISELACPNLYLNREINWLDFDAKVLDEATDAGLPLLEQLKFLSIFYNNLDEFFMVRVANIYRQYRSGAVSSSPDRMTPAKQLAEIRRKVLILVSRAQEHWRKRLAPQLHDKGVRLMRYADLSEKQRKFLDGYFRNEIYPILTPQAIDPGHPFPTISNTSLNFIIQLRSRDGVTRFARLKCPNNISRFVFIPRNKEAKTYASLGFNANVRDSDIILLEDLIAEYLGALFPGNTVVNAGLFRITRNTDVEIEEDEADDLLEAVKDLVEQRRFGDVVRLEIAHGTAKELSAFLTERLGMQPFQIYRVKGPLAFSELMALYGVDRPGLKESPFYGRTPSVFQEGDIYAHIQSRDVFLFHPYDSFTPVLDFIRAAPARTPASSPSSRRSTAWATLRPSCGPSSRPGAPAQAGHRRGRAQGPFRRGTQHHLGRGDWRRPGVNVVYGLVGMKIHAKLCLVVRREPDGVATLRAHRHGELQPLHRQDLHRHGPDRPPRPNIGADVTDLFNVMTGYAHREQYRELLVSPLSMRRSLLDMIQRETALHQQNGNGEIIFKCNQLVDKHVIRALYRASMEGVRVRLQVRGICCLRPGVKGISDNIEVTSIVGRFLEHTRVYWFNANGEGRLYIGSADIMPRNLDRRIEVLAAHPRSRIAGVPAQRYFGNTPPRQSADVAPSGRRHLLPHQARQGRRTRQRTGNHDAPQPGVCLILKRSKGKTMTMHTEDQLQEPAGRTQSDPGETPRQNGENRPRRRIAAQAEARPQEAPKGPAPEPVQESAPEPAAVAER